MCALYSDGLINYICFDKNASQLQSMIKINCNDFLHSKKSEQFCILSGILASITFMYIGKELAPIQ